MAKESIKSTLLSNRTITQDEYAKPEEIEAVDELVAEGFAIATPWAYRSPHTCKVRFVRRLHTHDGVAA
jgi:hypothetical protein